MNSYLIAIVVLGLITTSCSDDKKSKTDVKEVVPKEVIEEVVPEETPVIEVPEETPVEVEIKEGEVDENTDN